MCSFEHGLVQGQFRNQLLQSLVFLLQVLEAPGLLQSQPTVLPAPAVVALLTDSGLADRLSDRLALAGQYLDLLQPGDDLFRGECLCWHVRLLCVEGHCLSYRLDSNLPVRSGALMLINNSL